MSTVGHPLFWTLRSIARIERKGDLRAPRLTEPGLVKWNRVRRKLDFADLIALLHEDLTDAFPYPFDLSRWTSDPLDGLGSDEAQRLVQAALEEDSSNPQTFLRQAARALGLPAGGNIADLPKVQPHQSALELPGSGGRIAAQQFFDHGVAISDRFTFIAETDAERLCLGLALVEARSNVPEVWRPDEAKRKVEAGSRFDHVFGVPGHSSAEDFVHTTGLEARWS